jgi:hypothetical protein
MRTLALFVAGIVLTACGAGPGEPPPEAPGLAHELTLPAKLASSHEVTLYSHLDDGQATELTEVSYGLTDGYPTRVTLSARDGYVLSQGCELRLGAVVWQSIVEVQGTAAKLDLDKGTLALDLREEGDVSVLLEGEITEQHCTSGDGPAVTSIPLKHRVVLHVHRVAGFVVEQFHQQLADCWDSMVLPSGATLWAPAASPLDAEGQRFEAANAPTPVAITLRSDGALTPVGEAQLSAEAGTVSVLVDTMLPVQGLRSFDVVGPDALTAVEAALYLRKAASKGDISERIEEGMSYEIFFPELSNEVEIHVDSAMTARGKLCANIPAAWFSSTSATPEQCEASAEGTEAVSSSFVSVAAVRSPGECRLEVTLPGTSQRWTTKFSTTL